MIQELREQQRKGAALLDRKQPDWRNKLKRPVHLVSCKDCVLGQVYGDCHVGAKQLGITDFETYGFFAYYPATPLLEGLWNAEAKKSKR